VGLHPREGTYQGQAHQAIVALLGRLPQELVAGEVAVAEVELHLAKDALRLGFVERRGGGGGHGCLRSGCDRAGDRSPERNRAVRVSVVLGVASARSCCAVMITGRDRPPSAVCVQKFDYS